MRISSVEQFVACVLGDSMTADQDRLFWYRGQMREDWKLLPAVMRKEYNREVENTLNQFFRLRAYGHVQNRKNTDEWLFLAQHNGLPTRLLDWTENPLVALYFALCEYPSHWRHCEVWCKEACATEPSPPVVWRLRPRRLNKLATGSEEFPIPWHDQNSGRGAIPNIRGAWQKNKEGIALPIACYGPELHPRVKLQKGCFTVHGCRPRPLDVLLECEGVEHRDACLKVYPISGERKNIVEMLGHLRRLGVSSSNVFPELPALASDLADEHIPKA